MWFLALTAASAAAGSPPVVVSDGALQVGGVRLPIGGEPTPCPDTYDCTKARVMADGRVEVVWEARLNAMWRSVTTATVQPSPPALVSLQWSHPWPVVSTGFVDLRTLSGSFEVHGTAEAGCELAARGRPLPRVDVAQAFGVSLGTCAAVLTAADADAVIWGAPGLATDASVRAVMVSDRELWVELVDDVRQTGTGSWVTDDHVEVWIAPERSADCASAAIQWGITLDGSVHRGFGTPLADPVVEIREGRRMRIVLPWAPRRLSVVFSDSDDGESQERLLSTSRLTRGEPRTLSPVIEAHPLVSCTLSEAGLAPGLVPLRDGTELRSRLPSL